MMTAPYPPVDGTQACATGGTDTAVAAAFLGQPATDTSAAKMACHECAFLRPCRAYGLTHDVHGIWGGWDTVDRRDARRQHALPPPPSVTDELDALVLASRCSPPADTPTHLTGVSDRGDVRGDGDLAPNIASALSGR